MNEEKRQWKRPKGPKRRAAGNIELLAEVATVRFRGLLSGGAVWVPASPEVHERLEAVVTGLVDGGTEAADSLHDLLAAQGRHADGAAGGEARDGVEEAEWHESRGSRTAGLASTSGRFLVRLGAEEALFLVHGVRCLDVWGYDSGTTGKVGDAGSLWPGRPDQGSAHAQLRLYTADELFAYFLALQPRFAYKYLSYFHFRSKGWMIRSGVQFGCDFVLYQAHPGKVHSQFSVLVVPAAVGAAAGAREPQAPPVDASIGAGLFPLDPAFDWCEIRAVGRVCTQVSKRLILCYVAILPDHPTASSLDGDGAAAPPPGLAAIESLVDRSLLEEVLLQRWNPDRNRE